MQRVNEMEDIAAVLRAAEQRYFKEYYPKFCSNSPTGEYYGRGQLEGMAAALYPFVSLVDLNDIGLDPEFIAYLQVWGENHSLITF